MGSNTKQWYTRCRTMYILRLYIMILLRCRWAFTQRGTFGIFMDFRSPRFIFFRNDMYLCHSRVWPKSPQAPRKPKAQNHVPMEPPIVSRRRSATQFWLFAIRMALYIFPQISAVSFDFSTECREIICFSSLFVFLYYSPPCLSLLYYFWQFTILIIL